MLYNITGILCEALGINGNNIMLVDVSCHVNLLMKIGGFLSRRVGLVFPGRFLVTVGTLISYRGIKEKVKTVLSEIEHHRERSSADTMTVYCEVGN